jgi:hypothetical protein
MHVVFLCLESNKYFFTILIGFVLGLTSQLEIIIVLFFALPDRHLTSFSLVCCRLVAFLLIPAYTELHFWKHM